MREIPLNTIRGVSKGKYVALVDDEDYDRLIQKKWRVHIHPRGYYYAVGNDYSLTKRGRTIQMHRFIMNTPKGMVVDHKDHNGLNNCKSNLRNCSLGENNRNRTGTSASGYKGVYFRQDGNYYSYRSQIRVDSVLIDLGSFKEKNEAAIAYNNAAIKHFGEFAKLNIII